MTVPLLFHNDKSQRVNRSNHCGGSLISPLGILISSTQSLDINKMILPQVGLNFLNLWHKTGIKLMAVWANE